MNKPTLYTVTGLPYAGKSTLRRELVIRFGFEVISIDEINTMYGISIDKTKHITQKEWNKSYAYGYNKLKNYLKEGKDVIFDGGSLLLRERETQRRIAHDQNATSRLIYVNTPITYIQERWVKNQHTHERGHVPKILFDAALKMWEEPTPEESPILYNQKMELENWIKNIFILNQNKAK